MNKIEIKTGEAILAMYPLEMKTLKQLISAPTDILQESYLKPLAQLAEYLQLQAVSKIDETTIIKRQLNYAITMLKLRRGKLLPEHAEIETIAACEAVWSYAIFTIGLLHQLETVLKKRTITLFNQHGERLGKTLPIIGFFYESGAYYTINYDNEDALLSGVTPSLLRSALVIKIFPSVALQWITKYEALYQQWQKTIFLLDGEANVLDDFLKEMAFKEEPKKTEDKINTSEEVKEDDIKIQPKEEGLFFEKLPNYLKDEHVFLSQSGLFIEQKKLEQICNDHQIQNDAFFKVLVEKNHFIKNKQGDYQHKLTSKNITKKVIVSGYIFNVDALPEKIQAEIKTMTPTTEFSENLSL